MDKHPTSFTFRQDDCVSVTKFLCEGEAAAQARMALWLPTSPEHPMVGSFFTGPAAQITPRLGPEVVPMCRDALTSCSL